MSQRGNARRNEVREGDEGPLDPRANQCGYGRMRTSLSLVSIPLSTALASAASSAYSISRHFGTNEVFEEVEVMRRKFISLRSITRCVRSSWGCCHIRSTRRRTTSPIAELRNVRPSSTYVQALGLPSPAARLLTDSQGDSLQSHLRNLYTQRFTHACSIPPALFAACRARQGFLDRLPGRNRC